MSSTKELGIFINKGVEHFQKIEMTNRKKGNGLQPEFWVADITYVGTKAGFLYLSLLTDACSHKVVGYHIAPNPKAVHTLSALKMALHNHRSVNGLIHHSDRGIQYCSTNY